MYVIKEYGEDIISSHNMQSEKKYMQHGNVSVFEHSINVACYSVYLAERFKIDVDMRALVRGALLHDYFLYDWHIADSSHRFHGFTHANHALHNALNDFELGAIEKDIISKHMFPLNIKPPHYKESAIVCLADKACALYETLLLRR